MDLQRNNEVLIRGKIPLYAYVFLLACIVKQFYIGVSGSFQISDLLFFLSYFLMCRGNVFSAFSSEKNQKLVKFIFCTIIINGIYALIYLKTQFILSSLYYIFNLFLVFVFEEAMYYEEFLKKLETVQKINLLIQLAVYLANRGRWYMGERYQGTFNDPNQYAFFILTSFLMIALLMNMRNKMKWCIPWYILALFLLMPSSSTGMVIGFGAFIFLFILFSMSDNNGARILWFVVATVVFALFIMVSKGQLHLPASIENSDIYNRTMGKINNVAFNWDELLVDRKWYIVFDNWWMMLYGAGDGYFLRFGSGNEVHSSILAPLFYYGIIPFSILFSWCREKLRGIKLSVWCVYLSLILESVVLANNRQPVFWMIFVLAGHVLTKDPNRYGIIQPQQIDDR